MAAPVNRRYDRLARLERTLSAQIAELERGVQHRQPDHRAHPNLRGLRPLYTGERARRALVEDPHLVAQAFARFLFWRRYLASRRPTLESAIVTQRRLAGRFIWRVALRCRRAGKRLPLKDGQGVPLWVWQTQANGTTRRDDTPDGSYDPEGTAPDDDLSLSDEAADWWATYGSPELAVSMGAEDLSLDNMDPADVALLANGDGIPDGRLGLWSDFSSVSVVAAINRLLRLLTGADLTASGASLEFPDVFSAAREYGVSDMQVGQLAEMAWNGQAMQWSASDVLAAAGLTPDDVSGGVSIARIFDLRDQAMMDFLGNQAAWRVTQIDSFTRTLIARTLWSSYGGNDTFAPVAPDKAARILRQTWADSGRDLGDMSRARARMIAFTETARAESFGALVGMYQLGVTFTTWSVTTGACQECLGNAEAGPVRLYDAYPSGDQAPPAHPICRCALQPWVPLTFDPSGDGMFQPRDPAPLLAALGNENMTTWPESEMSGDFWDEIGPALAEGGDMALAIRPSIVRAGRTVAPETPIPGPVPWLLSDGGALLDAMHAGAPGKMATLAEGLAGVAELAAARWLEVARLPHDRLPLTHEKLATLADEVQQGRYTRSDAAYAQALRRGMDQALRQWRSHR